MGCIPSSTYPEHIPRNDDVSLAAVSGPSVQSGSDFVYSRQISGAFMGGGVQRGTATNNSNNFYKSDNLSEAPPLRVQSQGDVGADGIGLASTTYTTSSGRKYKFVYGRPVGFAGAEEIISCLDDVGMHGGNLYRLVRSKLVSIGEEEEEATAAASINGGGTAKEGRRHTDTLSESEALQREQGMDLVACSVTTRRRPADKSREAVLQEQYVVALLGTDTILDASAIAPSRRRSRIVAATGASAAAAVTDKSSKNNSNSANGSSHMNATQRLQLLNTPSFPTSTSSSNHSGRRNYPHLRGKKIAQEAVDDGNFDLDFEENQDYQMFPQEHYSALPAQRKAGAAVPIALCPPSRTFRVPVKYSAVEDRVVTAAGKAGKNKSWRDRVMPQRMFRLATSETRTWAFYNDSEYIMHVYTLFDRASKLEPRDSTRLWPSSVFDEGNEAPTPPPVFFGLFFDEGGEEAVPSSEVPDSVARRRQRIFGTRGMWIAEVLVPSRSTRLFVEGKVRGAYRMRCTRLDLDDLVAATTTAQTVAKKRSTRHVTDRFPFSLRRPGRNSASLRAAVTTTVGSAQYPLAEAETTEEDKRKGATAPASLSPGLDQTGLPTPHSDSRLPSYQKVPRTPHRQSNGAGALSPTNNNNESSVKERNNASLSAFEESAAATEKVALGIGCHSTLIESQGVLTRQTYLCNAAVSLTDSAAATLHAADDRFTAAGSGAGRSPLSLTEEGNEGPLQKSAGPGVVTEVLLRNTPSSLLPPLRTDTAAAHDGYSLASPVREAVLPSANTETGLRTLPYISERKGVFSTDANAAMGDAAAALALSTRGLATHPPSAVSSRRASHQEHSTRSVDSRMAMKGALISGDLFENCSCTSKRGAVDRIPLKEKRGDVDSADNRAVTPTNERCYVTNNCVENGAGKAPHFSPPFSSVVKLAVDNHHHKDGNNDHSCAGEEEKDMDSGNEAQSSCAEFAKVRPDRQRPAPVRGDAIFSGPAKSTWRQSTGDQGNGAIRSIDPTSVSLLTHAAMPFFMANGSNSNNSWNNTHCPAAAAAAADSGEGRQQLRQQLLPATPIRKSHLSPCAPEALSPRVGRKCLANVPCPAEVARSLEGTESCHSPGSSATLSTMPWQPKVHTLTPESSYHSERFRRTGMPSVSSCRTVAVDDLTGSLEVEGDV